MGEVKMLSLDQPTAVYQDNTSHLQKKALQVEEEKSLELLCTRFKNAKENNFLTFGNIGRNTLEHTKLVEVKQEMS